MHITTSHMGWRRRQFWRRCRRRGIRFRLKHWGLDSFFFFFFFFFFASNLSFFSRNAIDSLEGDGSIYGGAMDGTYKSRRINSFFYLRFCLFCFDLHSKKTSCLPKKPLLFPAHLQHSCSMLNVFPQKSHITSMSTLQSRGKNGNPCPRSASLEERN